MCTAVSVTAGDHYFGRNLDYEYDFGEKIVITPRKYEFKFQNGEATGEHYAIIGMALPKNDYPLYFDAANEAGLSVAGLNFPHFARYNHKREGKTNIASYEFIPWVLTNCSTVDGAKKLLENLSVTDDAFDESTPPTPLHWLISDRERSITVEQTQKGLFVYDNPVGVLTNSPTFDFHLFYLNNYLSLSCEEPQNTFSEKLSLAPYSRGMGGIGLPGDLSSQSRFVRAAFTSLNSVWESGENERVHQFFHILQSVAQTKGCARVEGEFEMTNYSSCINTDKGIYYYATYYNQAISKVEMHTENLDGENLIIKP